MRSLVVAVISFAAACGDNHAPPPTSERLIEAQWELPANSEGYFCAYKTITEDLIVGEFEPVIPQGTHHTVLTMGEPQHPDGVFPCDVVNNNPYLIFGSGVGTGPFTFPPGVGVRIPAGKQLILNLHLFNASDAPLSGLSGTDVKLLTEEELQNEAEAVLAGTIHLNITPGDSSAIGHCSIPGDVTLFAAGAHMHVLGRHMTVTAMPQAGEARTLLDHDYSFDSQLAYPLDPMMPMKIGDMVQIQCDYYNPSADTVHFGESTLDEMCFSGLYWYPTTHSALLCTN
jgi:hypothetical protein